MICCTGGIFFKKCLCFKVSDLIRYHTYRDSEEKNNIKCNHRKLFTLKFTVDFKYVQKFCALNFQIVAVCRQRIRFFSFRYRFEADRVELDFGGFKIRIALSIRFQETEKSKPNFPPKGPVTLKSVK